MPVTYASFVTAFPEFGNTTTFPQGQVEAWIGQAGTLLNPTRFRASADLVTMLFVAHSLALGAAEARAAAQGGVPGQPRGVMSSKSVDGVSVSYDTSLGTIEGAGVYNLTGYGRRLWALIRAFGRGGFYRPGPDVRGRTTLLLPR